MESSNIVFFGNIRTSVDKLSPEHQEVVIAYCFYHIKNILQDNEELSWFESIMVSCPRAFNKMWQYQKENKTSLFNGSQGKRIETIALKNHLMQDLPITKTNAKMKLKV